MKIILKVVKFAFLITAIAWFGVAKAQTVAEIKIDVEIESKPLKEVFTYIEVLTDLHFVYNENLVSTYDNISVTSKNRTVASILNEVLGNTNLRYIQQSNKIIIEKKDAVKAQASRGDVITGIILEEGTVKPVRNASVYFDGTMNGTTSDSSGNFTLDIRSATKLRISVTAVGYSPGSVSDYTPGTKVTIYLKSRSYELDAVEITANDGLSRKDKLRIFKREFLGDDDNAWNCDILNEDDIRLTYNMKKNILHAYCSNPIIVRNKNLGYILNFTLESFTYSDDGTFFTGTQFFKEDPNPEDVLKVQKARKATYLGSRMHFIRSLWNNDLKKNNFRINRSLGYQVYYEDLVVEHNNQKFMNPSETLEIIYKWSKSNLFKNTLGKEIYIDRNGYNNPVGVNWAGAIGDERIADSLPMEYGLPAPGSDEKGKDAEAVTLFSVPLDTLRSKMPVEKLYIQFDKPYYTSGDTLRMKAYLLDAALLRGSINSGLVHIELVNDSNYVVLRRNLPVGYGLGTGNIALNPGDVPEGGYTLRAYTNLMRNFGEFNVFEKHFYVGSTSQNMLVNSLSSLSRIAGKNNLRLAMRFSELNKKPIAFRDIDLRVQEGKKVLFRDKIKTDVNGNTDINFVIPEKTAAKAVSIIAGNGKDMPALTIPVSFNRPENTDLQFMPEGGNLVAGITSRVGFKAIGEDGNALEVSGHIYDENNVEVSEFKSSYKGMGSFELTPKTGEYTAKVLFNDGTTKSFTLPSVKNTGTTLRVTNTPKNEWITVTVSKSANISPKAKYYLVGQARGMVEYEEVVSFDGFASSVEKIPKNLFPTGIVRFTLMSIDKKPLNERITFVDHHDNLNIQISPDKAAYPTRDSVALAIQVTDDSGRPVQGTFSLAVTDDNQVKTDSLSNNIVTSVLLTSGLRGTVEEPAHYFQKTAESATDFDCLLLTQGWIGYDWKDVFNVPSALAYRPEFELTVHGKITNANNTDITTVQLLSSNPPFFMRDTVDADRSFKFSGLPVIENLHLFIQAKNARNKNVEAELDAFKPPVFKPSARRFMPWYVNSDTTVIHQVIARPVQQAEVISKGTNLLQEVTISEKKIIKGSRNLNGPGESDQTLDEKDLADAPKKTLLDVMQEKIKGFNIGIFPDRNPPAVGLNSINNKEPGGPKADAQMSTASLPFVKKQSYRINDKEIHLVIDGVDVEQFYLPAENRDIDEPMLRPDGTIIPIALDYVSLRNGAPFTDRLEFIKAYLRYIKAGDVKGIEVMFNPNYNGKYKTMFASGIAGNLSIITTDFAYVEVTTYSGNGAFMMKLPGIVYNPVSFTNSATFYRPKYTSKTSSLPDFRSTIHWEPDILTDKDGKATVSFYSADKPGTYSIIAEGSNMNGSIGRKTGSIRIK